MLEDCKAVLDLTTSQKRALVKFRCVSTADESIDFVSPVKEDATLKEKVEKKAKKRKLQEEQQRKEVFFYRGLEAISPTSNVCERLFSISGVIWSDLRKSMKPSTL
jgi:hypothetical protein